MSRDTRAAFEKWAMERTMPRSVREWENATEEAWQAAYAAGMERAAEICEARAMGDNNREDQEAKRCAAAIRRASEETTSGAKP
jgi:hypothetical protein